jgi:hypothetical protein
MEPSLVGNQSASYHRARYYDANLGAIVRRAIWYGLFYHLATVVQLLPPAPAE